MQISIIIPTRQRAGTLASCLKTCMAQQFQEVEFIVSNNASTDATRDVVAACNDPRIRLIETPSRLSMSENWEFALAHARGRYIGYLGDDDGILPHGLEDVWRSIEAHEYPDAVACPRSVFVWPGSSEELKYFGWHPGTLIATIGPADHWVDSMEMLHQFSKSAKSFGDLPCLYYGLAKAELIQKARVNGRFFHSRIPDVYSAIALASVSQKYVMLQKAYALPGLSNNSSGVYMLYGESRKQPDSNPAHLFGEEKNLPFHADLVECPSAAVLMAESFLQVKDLGLMPGSLEWDYPVMLANALAELPTKPEQKQLEILDGLRWIAKRHHLDQDSIPETPLPLTPKPGINRSRIDLINRQVYLDANSYRLNNIYDATVTLEPIQDILAASTRTLADMELAGRYEQLSTAHQNHLSEHHSLQVEHHNLQAEHHSLRTEHQKLQAKRQSLQARNETLQEKSKKLRHKLESARLKESSRSPSSRLARKFKKLRQFFSNKNTNPPAV